MSPWILYAGLTVATLALLTLPLLRRQPGAVPARADYDVAVYRDQLAEVERDLKRGLLTEDQAQAARVEVQRRILAAAAEADAGAEPAAAARWGAVVAMLVLLPAMGFGLYHLFGSPNLPGRPYAEVQAQRLNLADDQTRRILMMVDKLVQKVEANPDDVPGWQMLGRSYMTLGRLNDAANAYRRAVAAGASDDETLSALGEIIVREHQGTVTQEARDVMVRVLRQNPADPRARYYIGVERFQVGDTRAAIAVWRDIERDSPPDAPWLPAIREQIALAAKKSGIDPAAVAPENPLYMLAPPAPAAPQLQRQQSFLALGVAASLEEHVRQSPDDGQLWARLARTQRDAGDADKALASFGRANQLLPGDAEIAQDYRAALQAAASAAAHAGDDTTLRNVWGRLLGILPYGSPEAVEIRRRLAEMPMR